MKQSIQSQNLSSIMIYSGASYLEAAESLANREYGHYIEDLGYLSKTADNKSYWTKYPDLLYEETSFTFSKIKEIYQEGYSYLTKFYDINSGNLSIKEITGNGKSLSRYHAEYSYQNDLANSFSNIVPYTAYDLNNFLFSLNYQKYNKQTLYGDDFEVNSIRIGAKTFDWHLASDIAYVITESHDEDITYYFAYTSSGTYFNNPSQISADTQIAYSYTYNYTDTIVEYTYYRYGEDNYYAYLRKQYEPIVETLEYEIQSQVNEFAERHGNNEDLYTYYMYDCNIDIPMTLTTRSMGVKKSTFEMRYNSAYDYWFETGIPVYFNFDAPERSITLSAYNDGTFGMRTNEYENIFDSDVTVETDNNHTFIIDNTDETEYDNETEFTILSPNNVSELTVNSPAGILNLTKTGWTTTGNHIEKLVISNSDGENDDKLEKILGINDLLNLKEIYLINCKNLKSTPSISNLSKLEMFDASSSNIQSFKPADGVKLQHVYLPTDNSLKTIRLKNVEIDEDGSFIASVEGLNSVTFDNVKNFDTYDFVTRWNESLKSSNKLIPNSLIYLELNKINWEKVPVTIMEDIKEFDLKIREAEISVLGTSNYGMLSRKEYMKMTDLYGVNAFDRNSTTEKVFENLILRKHVNALPDYEYTFDVTSNINNYHTEIKFDNNDNPDTIIAVNAIISEIIGNSDSGTIEFEYDEHEKYIYHKFDSVIDTKDTIEAPSKLYYGDVLLYNGDTIIIVMDYIAENRYQYIKLGSISDLVSNSPSNTLKNWFNNTDIVDITFTQTERPITINNIDVSYNDEVVDRISMFESDFETENGVQIQITVDEPTAEQNKIKVKKSDTTGYDSTAITVTSDNEFVFPKTYTIKLNPAKTGIPMFGSKDYKLTFCLDEKIGNILLEDIIYKEFIVTVLSDNETSGILNDTVIVDNDNVEFNDGVLTFLENTASFDEDTGILTIE